MEFVRFIFSSFWTWLGFTVLTAVAVCYLAVLVKACKPETRRVETYRDADRLKVTIIGATAEEAKAAREEVVTATYNGYGYKLAGDGKSNGEDGKCTN